MTIFYSSTATTVIYTLSLHDALPIYLHDALQTKDTYGQYFKEEVRKRLVAQFGQERVYEGGLKVYTTMDPGLQQAADRKSTRLNSSHSQISYAVFCLKKKICEYLIGH